MHSLLIGRFGLYWLTYSIHIDLSLIVSFSTSKQSRKLRNKIFDRIIFKNILISILTIQFIKYFFFPKRKFRVFFRKPSSVKNNQDDFTTINMLVLITILGLNTNIYIQANNISTTYLKWQLQLHTT